MSTAPIRLLVADDHHVVRFGLCSILDSDASFKVVADTGNGRDIIKLYKKHSPDLCIIDISMPDMDGIEATRNLVELDSSAKVIILTMHLSEDYLNKVIQAGASGYILKNTNKDELLTALKDVASGKSVFSNSISSMMADKYAEQIRKPGDQAKPVLTKRESQILSLIVDGYTSHEIGAKLFISPRTVDTHRNNLIHKIGVKNTAALVRYALENHIGGDKPKK